jgi:ABC-type multidrug transport system fused ATPase/permease subunit
MQVLLKYLKLCKDNTILLIIGLFFGSISSYYKVYTKEYLSIMLNGDISVFDIYIKYCIITVISTAIRCGIFTYTQNSFYNKLTKLIYNKILFQKNEYYETTPVSTLLDICNNDIRITSDIISLYINTYTRNISSIICILYLLSNISYQLSLILTLIIISYCFTIKNASNFYNNKMLIFQEIKKQITSHIHETISHISIIKTFANEYRVSDKINKLCDDLAKHYWFEILYHSINTISIYNIDIIINIFIILYSDYFNINIVSFILHKHVLLESIESIITFNSDYSKCTKSLNNIIYILDNQYYNKGIFIPFSNNIKGNIIFKDICFYYNKSPEKVILNDFNFEINEGSKIGFIGASGCGKSTIAKLLLGIIKQQKGSIYIDNIDINIYNNKWIKNQIGYVSQDNILFSDTILNNITYGLDNYDINDVINIAKIANAHEFISELPNEYNTIFDATELSSLSGGQKQRIAIARALMRKPKILIFDEATSALDPHCEEIVQNTINNTFSKINRKSTIIVIAHRKSALNFVDKIYTFKSSSEMQEVIMS